jgi:single-stranded DNA-binding protein
MEDDTTKWHTVKAWRALAEKARDQLSKGQLAEVRGYADEEKHKGKDGVERVQQIIRAAAIIPK